LDFKFPEISTSKVVTYQARVDDKTASIKESYYIIVGMAFMTSIGITVVYEQICIIWGGTEILHKTRNVLSDNDILKKLYHTENGPDILQEA
jgi:hypothetical protein